MKENTSSNKYVFITSNGCNRRLLDAARLKQYFKQNNFNITNSPQNADFLFLFASALNQVRIDESLNLIKKLNNYNGEFFVLGCLPETSKEQMQTVFQGKSFPIKDMHLIDAYFPDNKISYKDIAEKNVPLLSKWLNKNNSFCFSRLLHLIIHPNKLFEKIYLYRFRKYKEDYSSSFIWVSRGCPNNCSFCAEKNVVGKVISRSIEEISNDYIRLIEDGERTFEFIGDDVGSYGLDINTSLPELLNAICKEDEGLNTHWMIKHLHPKFMILYKNELLPVIRSKRVTEIICSFQSGSNKILDLMNRNHTIEQVIETLSLFIKEKPNIKLATNIIIGFPGETEEDFLATLNVFKKIKFTRVHIIKYYDAENTESYRLENKVDEEIIKERIQKAKRFFRQNNIFYQSRD